MPQVFIPWVKTLPQDEVKVLISDNLAAHLSPVVIAQCEEYNIRFIFLPENATHMLQPLDVTVFGPMKRRWREILADWKEDNMKRGVNYSTIPKQVSVNINYQYQTYGTVPTGTYVTVFISVPDPDPPGSEIIWPQLKDPDPDLSLFHTKLRNTVCLKNALKS